MTFKDNLNQRLEKRIALVTQGKKESLEGLHGMLQDAMALGCIETLGAITETQPSPKEMLQWLDDQ